MDSMRAPRNAARDSLDAAGTVPVPAPNLSASVFARFRGRRCALLLLVAAAVANGCASNVEFEEDNTPQDVAYLDDDELQSAWPEDEHVSAAAPAEDEHEAVIAQLQNTLWQMERELLMERGTGEALSTQLAGSESARNELQAEISRLRAALAAVSVVNATVASAERFDFSRIRFEEDKSGEMKNVFYVVEGTDTPIARVRFGLPASEQEFGVEDLEGAIDWMWLPDNRIASEISGYAEKPTLALSVGLNGAQWEKSVPFSEFESGMTENWTVNAAALQGSGQLSYELAVVHPALPNARVRTANRSLPLKERSWYHEATLKAAEKIGASFIAFIIVIATTLTGGFVTLRGLWLKVTKAMAEGTPAGDAPAG